MLIYIISAVAVIIASLCFFKDEFWENRYAVLLLIMGVGIIATLTTSFIVRDNLEIKIIKTNLCEFTTFYVADSVLNDMEFDFVNDYEIITLGSLESTAVNFVIFNRKDEPYIGYVNEKGKKKIYKLSKIHFVEGNEMGLLKVEESYVGNKWVSGFSIPNKSSNRVVSVPSSELDKTDRSLINKLPFEL